MNVIFVCTLWGVTKRLTIWPLKLQPHFLRLATKALWKFYINLLDIFLIWRKVEQG